MIPLLLSPILISVLPFTFGLCILLGVLSGLVPGLYYVTTDNLQIRAHTKINLAKFDAYCNDITQGLPAEIELRQKQYEYYRDKLLTFKELE